MCEGVEEEVGVQGRRNSFDSQVEAVQALVVEAVVELVVAAAAAMVAAAAAENLGEDMEVESPVAVVNGRCDGGGGGGGHSFRLRY